MRNDDVWRDGPARAAGWRPRLGVPALTVLVALFIIGVDNVAFWRRLAHDAQISGRHHLDFGIAVAVFLVAALSFLLSLFAFRFLYKPFLVVVLLLASVISYFMMTYGIVVNDTMITNTLDTDLGEASGLFNLTLVWHVLLTGVLPALAVAALDLRRYRFLRQTLSRIVFALVMLGIAGGAIALEYKDFALTLRQNRELRLYINPTYAIYSAYKLASQAARTGDIPLHRIGLDAHRTATAASRGHRKIMIFVVGETTRAANWGMDGYRRNTTPDLEQESVINFTDAHSCGTSTAVSVPCMFSPRDRKHFDRDTARHSENLLDVLQRAGVTVRWEENQAGGCKGVCARVPTRNMRTLNIPGICGDGHCLDAVFLKHLADRIERTRGDVLIVMHTMGSHGPDYYRRYPDRFKIYTPICHSNRPQDCSTSQLINSYDNTVRYVDHILASLIAVLKRESGPHKADTALMYLSDHGESLGENGLYLHGFPYLIAPREQTHIPMIAWFSPGFLQDSHLQPACMRAQAARRVGQNNVFDTVMALMDVRAGLYDPKEDIFAPCRGGLHGASVASGGE